jgi:hypothetical protein
LSIAYRKREAARMSKRAFIKRIGEVVSHDCSSLLNKKGYQWGQRLKEGRPKRCVGKGN